MKSFLKATALGALLATASAPALAAEKDIVDTAVEAGSFETLVAAVKAAGLVDTLKGEGPFTVFAPTDDAFAKLPDGTVEDLLKPENKDRLTEILTYHVIATEITSDEIAGQSMEVQTQALDTVMVDATDGVTVNGANVVQADVQASNGVIHAIDTVLMPE
jgi:uncharacterized surface protein with fasciclin (FAS1) repeats